MIFKDQHVFYIIFIVYNIQAILNKLENSWKSIGGDRNGKAKLKTVSYIAITLKFPMYDDFIAHCDGNISG